MTMTPSQVAAPATTARWSGAELLAALRSGTNQLLAHLDRINALNVFPVPDGDTGTNMGLTMRAALEEVEKLPSGLRGHAGEVAKRVEFGSLMGARGNSGVILSQIFRGFAREVAILPEINGADLARALAGARDLAYKAVMEPVEGTMLTVIRVAAEQAAIVPSADASLARVSSAALAGAQHALERTPDMLARLREAGVVDAGGQGIVYLLDGLDRYARGEPITASEAASEPSAIGSDMAFLDQVAEFHGDDAFGYCTNFMVFGEDIPFEKVRADIAAMGYSAVIVGDDRIVKVHIHTEDPGSLLSYAVRFGDLGQIKIDNMSSQVEVLTSQRTAAAEAAPGDSPAGTVALLPVASGRGLCAAFRDMGATAIIEGGQTMNPSIEELLSAVEETRCDEVILLPNNPNILMAANRVPELSTKRVAVVPSKSVPQGMAALQAFNPVASFDANVSRMSRAVGGVRTVEVTRADKNASIDGIDVVKGQLIGLVDDKLRAAGDDEVVVTANALTAAGVDDAELVTIFTGDGQTPEQAAAIRDALEAAHPDVEFEFHDGGQPHYRYVIAVE